MTFRPFAGHRMTDRKCLLVLVTAFLCIAFATLSTWTLRGINPITGDEPHYLVMTSGFIRHWSFEQTLAYAEEAKTHDIFKARLPDMHAERGPNGLYNVHGIGLPILLAVPFAVYGVLGAKIFMILTGVGVVATSWAISGLFTTNRLNRLCSVIAVCIGMPLIPASNQIYTDIPAGAIALWGIYWFMTLERRNRLLGYVPVAGGLALLPWLHARYAAAAAILFIAIIWNILRYKTGSIRNVAALLMVAFLASSISGLIAYNLYAFGNPVGAHLLHATLKFSEASLMVLFGLFADQNQGFLLQNPVMLVGLIFAGSLFVADRKLFALWSLVFLSLIVPNSLQTGLYGGWCFAGRYQWAASMVFILPTLFGLVRMSVKTPKVFYVVVGVGLFLQAYFFWQYTFGNISLYNRPEWTLLKAYSIFYNRIYCWLPILYNVNFAFKYLPNLAWLIALCSLTVAGFVLCYRPGFPSGKLLAGLWTFCMVLIIPSGSIFKAYGNRTVYSHTWSAKDLPSDCGHVEGTDRIAEESVDRPGMLNFGPYTRLPSGRYRVVIRYESSAALSKEVGTFDVVAENASVIAAAVPLYGTLGTINKASIAFRVPERASGEEYEFRSHWNGASDLRALDIHLEGQ
jgi:hypothetical protein